MEWTIEQNEIPIGFFQTKEDAVSALQFVSSGIIQPRTRDPNNNF